MKFSFFFFSAMPIADAISEHWDSPPLLIAKLATIGALVALNGFFVAAEFALVKVRRSQVDTLATEGNKRAAAGKHVIENLNAYLSACQLGITLASLGLGWLGEPFLARMLQPIFSRVGLSLWLSRHPFHSRWRSLSLLPFTSCSENRHPRFSLFKNRLAPPFSSVRRCDFFMQSLSRSSGS